MTYGEIRSYGALLRELLICTGVVQPRIYTIRMLHPIIRVLYNMRITSFHEHNEILDMSWYPIHVNTGLYKELAGI